MCEAPCKSLRTKSEACPPGLTVYITGGQPLAQSKNQVLASSELLHVQTTFEECVTGFPYIITSHLDKVVFSFDIHILIKKMLLICMESFKKLSKQCSHMANNNL